MIQAELFELPPYKPRRPQEPIIRDGEFSSDGRYRWVLKRAWGAGPCILWAGLNPSIADTKIDDPTIIREMTFSLAWGFGSMIKLNVYPLRSPTTDKLRLWLKERDDDMTGARNAWIHNCTVAAGYAEQCSMFVAAWGNGALPADLKLFLENMDSVGLDEKRLIEDAKYDHRLTWHCIGETLSWAPKHPLARGVHRIPDTAKPIVWRQGTYPPPIEIKERNNG